MRISTFWQRVRALMKEKQVSQAAAAKICGVPLSTFKRWISKNTIPTLDVASAISRYFGISLDYLVYGKEEDQIAKIEEIIKSLETITENHKKILQNYPRTK